MSKKQVERQIRRTIEEYNLLRPNDKILVACSGGLDSLALLHSLWALKKWLKTNWILGVASLDHGIRPESQEEVAYVAQMAQDLGLACHVRHVNVPALAKEHKNSLETEARQVRYDFFAELVEQEGYQVVALAHHKDDQAETILGHLVRGAGLEGLGGMTYRRSFQQGAYLVRPLLDLTKEELRAYAEGLPYRWFEDPSNTDVTYTRNYLRHKILPGLEEINPNVVEALCRLGDSAREDQALLGQMTQDLFSRIVEKEGDTLCVSRRALRQEPKALQHRLWQAMVDVLGGGVTLSYAHRQQMDQLVATGEGKTFTVNRVRDVAQCDTIVISVL